MSPRLLAVLVLYRLAEFERIEIGVGHVFGHDRVRDTVVSRVQHALYFAGRVDDQADFPRHCSLKVKERYLRIT